MSPASRMIRTAILLLLAVACAGPESEAGKGKYEGIRTEERKTGVTGKRERRYAPGEVLVRFRNGTDAGTIARIQREVHLETVRVVSSPDLYLMRIVDHASVEETVQRLQRYDEVVVAEPNYVRRIQ